MIKNDVNVQLKTKGLKMISMSNQSQKADILLYIINISITKLGNEKCLDPEKVKQKLYEALIIIYGLIDFMVGKEENVTNSANST